MNSLVHVLLERKLRSLRDYLDELAAVAPAVEADYDASPTVRRAVERLVQVVVECAADAGDLLLTVQGVSTGDSAREIFSGLHAAGVIDVDLHRRFAHDYSGVRNRIVHDYDKLDHAAIWRTARQLAPDGRALLAALLLRLGKQGD